MPKSPNFTFGPAAMSGRKTLNEGQGEGAWGTAGRVLTSVSEVELTSEYRNGLVASHIPTLPRGMAVTHVKTTVPARAGRGPASACCC